MWIVKVALQRPYTFITLAALIVLLGGYAIAVTATDIFPNIRIPVTAGARYQLDTHCVMRQYHYFPFYGLILRTLGPKQEYR